MRLDSISFDVVGVDDGTQSPWFGQGDYGGKPEDIVDDDVPIASYPSNYFDMPMTAYHGDIDPSLLDLSALGIDGPMTWGSDIPCHLGWDELGTDVFGWSPFTAVANAVKKVATLPTSAVKAAVKVATPKPAVRVVPKPPTRPPTPNAAQLAAQQKAAREAAARAAQQQAAQRAAAAAAQARAAAAAAASARSGPTPAQKAAQEAAARAAQQQAAQRAAAAAAQARAAAAAAASARSGPTPAQKAAQEAAARAAQQQAAQKAAAAAAQARAAAVAAASARSGKPSSAATTALANSKVIKSVPGGAAVVFPPTGIPMAAGLAAAAGIAAAVKSPIPEQALAAQKIAINTYNLANTPGPDQKAAQVSLAAMAMAANARKAEADAAAPPEQPQILPVFVPPPAPPSMPNLPAIPIGGRRISNIFGRHRLTYDVSPQGYVATYSTT